MNIIEFDKKVTCGPEFVAVRIIENCETLKIGNIHLPESTGENARLAFCRVEDVGAKAAEEYGLKTGDYVMIDRLSTFAHTAPVAVLRYNNVICLTDEKRETFKPLKNMLFVEPDEKDSVSNVGGIYVSNYANKLNTGVITAKNADDCAFSVGDRVMLTKGADVVNVGSRRIFVYKPEMLACRIED